MALFGPAGVPLLKKTDHGSTIFLKVGWFLAKDLALVLQKENVQYTI